MYCICQLYNVHNRNCFRTYVEFSTSATCTCALLPPPANGTTAAARLVHCVEGDAAEDQDARQIELPATHENKLYPGEKGWIDIGE